MCILCVIQKWSRRVATMLPWLVIPLIGLWALSQLLPPDFRFEITSPRLACVFVLLVTLFWYEILMPQLSAWRVRRNQRLRERKRFEAIELQKLRKTATRRCRNCLTPYRDQNPGGGRFMCSYCGHISKRPVLDLPVPPGMRISNSGIIKDLVGKGGKILNGKGWSDNLWTSRQDWSENGNWVAGSVSGKLSYWHGGDTGVFGGDEDCLAEKSYSGIVIFACKLLTSFFLSIRWLLRKIFMVSSWRDDVSSDSDHRGMLTKRGENGTTFQESREEKARRKAEEKRQARLEKELLEEEERKQREEVARLVEEQRKLRDEKLEAEKNLSKLSTPAREKEMKKDAEKKRQDRRKEKDKASSKSNSDVEELEKRTGFETERKRDTDKKSEINHQEHQKSGLDNVKGTLETGHGLKYASANNFSRVNAGSRYFDRMKGTFFSSSKAFSGSSFFGKSANTPATITKENKTTNSVDHANISAHRRDFRTSEHVAGKLSINGDDKNVKISHPVLSETQPRAAPKKSWQQLFTHSPSVPQVSNANVISRPNSKIQAEAQNAPFPGHSSTMQTFDSPINFVLPSPFISTYQNGAPSNSLGFSPAVEPVFSRASEGPHEFITEEPELFEDPCYVPDPVSLLGPVSESLDHFQMDLGAGFGREIGMGMERPRALNNISAPSEIIKPSPIENPLSRLRSADEGNANSTRFPTFRKSRDLHSSPVDVTNANDTGTWQMWNSSPLEDGLGLVGGPASWLLPLEHNVSNKENFALPSTQTMASLFAKEDPLLAGTQSPLQVFPGNGQHGGAFNPVNGPSDHDPWLQNAFFPPLSGCDNHFPIKAQEDVSERSYGSPSGAACTHPFELSPANCWPKKEWGMKQGGEVVGSSSIARPSHVGGLFTTPDVQSLW
ncbi:hypothetical protein V6N13_040812 [Hibiscus sabdariffa]|uniref:Stress response NST1-like protein n=1 Tax=Hibiscus sabdariffa TaxID=183260 RepID=A0ABR2R9G4_9ROSI